MKFGELEIGAVFYDPRYEGAYHEGFVVEQYKIGPGLAVEMRHGFRVEVSDDLDVRVLDRCVSVHPNTVTEIERAALAMLDDNEVWHPCLQLYVQALCTDPTEFRRLDDYILDTEDDLSWLEGRGFAFPVRLTNCAEDTLFLKLLDYDGIDWDGIGSDRIQQRFWKSHERVVALLADAVREYRQRGRPDGDHTFDIMGMGAPLLRVTTSLAAAVAEFQQQMRHAYENQLYKYELKRGQ